MKLRVVVLLLLIGAEARAGDDARTLLVESEARHRSKTQEYRGSLEVVSADGKSRKKAWRSYRQGYAGDARLLIRFVEPAEVRGVGYLSLGRPGKNPEQWLYLPSMKRERRIASQDRDSSFIGTDFNYEDMEDFDHAKYEVALDGEEVVDGQPCLRIEAKPRERSVYVRKLLWLRRDLLLLVRVDAFKKGASEPHKRLILSRIEEVDGHTVARRMEMTDLTKKSRTTVALEDVAFDKPQPDDRFTIMSLNREEGE